MPTPFVQDSAFYELVHKICAKPDSDEDGRNRRIADRKSFPTVQLVAPIVDGKLPRRDELSEVWCHDLSTSGISFFAPQPPESDRLVVALASAIKTTYVSASVAYCRPMADGGQQAFLVGCRFTGRVEL